MNKFELSKNEFEDFYNLYLYSFNRKNSEYRKKFIKTRYNNSQPYGYFGNSQLLTSLLTIPFQVHIFESELNMSGISDVMSLPENISDVSAGSLLKVALKNMYKEEVELSYLAPFSFRYYRKFGYEYVFDRYCYSVKADKLSRIKTSNKGSFKKVSLNSVTQELKEFYSYTTKNESGGIIRPDWWWDYLPQKHPDWELIEYTLSNEIKGYLIYLRTENEFQIKELIYSDFNAFNMLMNFVYRHLNSYEKFTYESPIPKNNLSIFSDPGAIELKVKPYMMARIVNLSKLLSKINLREDIKLKVNDDIIEENNGCWNLNGVKEKSFDIEIDIRELTQVLLGKTNMKELFKFGKIDGNYKKITEFDDQFSVKVPILREYF
ncbi:GNAT family N-acetyltransferase [Companilactobacillus sp. DQM5]|uniref:GNAT family N-acetyltransferase n=1 Tax=Companilactobacillus sp. DQM5 TaxID=3463359 RepID=UPI004058BA16